MVQIWRWRSIFVLLAAVSSALFAQTAEDLRSMSIADLADIDVSSVTKSAGPLSDAPASIFVITHDDIARSGATTIPEMLRLAPNLHVAQTGASTYAIVARGQNGNNADQNFPNKLLVLVDGRSVYTPLFSGVYWDMQYVLPADIDRIEVISGPGATLWGANAFNGVINVITRKSANTQGISASITGGNQVRDASMRYGGRRGDSLSYRFYVDLHGDRSTDLAGGGSAHDKAHREQGGFRVDWTPADSDMFTLQGDLFRGKRDQGISSSETIRGQNLLARWNRSGGNGSKLQIQAYYDHIGRGTAQNSGSFVIDTYDLDVQDSFAWGGRQTIVVGGGLRASRYDIRPTVGANQLIFAPPKRTLYLGNVFAQDSVALGEGLTAIVGLKMESDPYVGAALLPQARLSWKLGEDALLWAAASRAIRSPTPFDRDVVEKVNGATLLTGSQHFRTEKVTAYELGTRLQPTVDSTLSISGFYNHYDDLRSIDITPLTVLPLMWGNGFKGHSYGFDAWADYQLMPRWRIGGGWSMLIEHFHAKSATSALLGPEQLGDDPRHRASLRSTWTLGPSFTLEGALRYVSKLPNPYVRHYIEADARIAWQIEPRLSLAVVGSNLLHDRHVEYAGASAVPRSIFAELRWRP